MQNTATAKLCLALLNIAGFVLLLFCARGQAFGQTRPQTLQQIQRLVGEKKLRTPVERKISSQLLQALREAGGGQMVDGTRLKPADVGVDSAGMLPVDINATVTNGLLLKIKQLGGKIIHPSVRFQSVRAQVSLSMVATIAGYPEVTFIRPAAKAQMQGGGAEGTGLTPGDVKYPSFKQRAEAIRKQLQQYLLMPGIGAATSQGDHTMGADSARKTYGYQGEGIRIGVLSDSYNGSGQNKAAADVASGDLPGPGNPFGNTTPVTVLEDYPGTDEGRAMLQIVHDLAPKAQLFFATAYPSDAAFADNILALRAAPNNCDIIVDDVRYFDEPAYQDGVIAQAVNTVTASGALYFSSAGNGGSFLTSHASVWEGDFNSNGSPPFDGDEGKTGSVHNFGTLQAPQSGDAILITTSTVFTLKWADALGKSSNDYDLFIVNQAGDVEYSSTDIQDGTQNPYEEIDLGNHLQPNSGYQLLVFKAASAKPVTFVINANANGAAQAFAYTTPGIIFGHSAAQGAFGVAATPAPAAYPGIFTSGAQVDYFSADGPRHIFFNTDGTPVTPGNFLLATNGGTVRNKPDLTAADGVSTTFSYGSSLNPFYGTSAAAPHAAAVAALIKSANPLLSPQQMRNLLTGTALDIEAPGYDYNSGYGIVRAFNAMQTLNPKPLPCITAGKIQVTEAAFSNHNGNIDPGEAGQITVQLVNKSLANATNVRAVVTSATQGVTVLRDSSFYGTILQGGGATNSGSPFTFTVSPTVACGTEVVFIVLVSCDSAGLNAWAYTDTVLAGTAVGYNISSALGRQPPTGAGYTAFTSQMHGHINENTPASACGGYASTTSLTDTANRYQFDAYTFTNTQNTPECITVNITTPVSFTYNVSSAAYSDGGIVPTNPSINFIGYSGPPAQAMQYSFTAKPGEKFTVVVSDLAAFPASGTQYNLSVSYAYCTAAPPCTQAAINSPLTTGTVGMPYRQILTAAGGSGQYQFSVAGILPPGIFFNGDSLYGIPSQAGSYPVTVSLTDPLSCIVSTSVNDTLLIAGTAPDSLVVYAGSGQQATVRQQFGHVLQARVFGGQMPLAGVRVTFATPGGGTNGHAGGSFAGGTDTVAVLTDSLGIASSPPITADSVSGGFTVTASLNNGVGPVNFALTNTCLSTVVTTGADDGPGSLRYIVQNACPGAGVTFAPGISQINLTSGHIHILQGITITGPGANRLAISGGNQTRIFSIALPNASDTVNIAGLTLTNGRPQQYPVLNGSGGGAVCISGGNVILSDCALLQNDASLTPYGEGGAIFTTGANLTINNCTIAQNKTADEGGGIINYGGSLHIYNSTVTGNVSGGGAYQHGGGVYMASGNFSMVNCTVFGNTAPLGANIYVANANTQAYDTLKNTIVAGGITPMGFNTGAPDLWGSGYVSAGYNLIQDTSAFYAFNGGPAPTDIRGVNAALLPLGNYGGTTPTLLPRPSSPVINKGNPALTTAQFDQRGYTRVAAGRADIGAVEANYLAQAVAGTPQTAEVNKQFAMALQTNVTENGNGTAGIGVIFNAPPDSSAGALFNNGHATDTVSTDTNGIVNVPVTANGNAGMYNVTAGIGLMFAPASFKLANTKTLAVNFGPVMAAVNNCAVQITWQTLTGETGEAFTLEQSTDGINYTTLYTTTASGNSALPQTYHYTDRAPANGTNYYRVMQTDVNGAVSFSTTVVAANTCGGAPMVAYPNPAHTMLTLVVQGADKQTIHIYDAMGRLITTYASVTGQVDVDVSRWAAGAYTIVATKGGKVVGSVDVIKN